ncbi:MAG: helix-turn-helix domain-containing protein [Oscillospiraceae bacterium]|jgi:transcriptional regulator with XRE-family HTH domain
MAHIVNQDLSIGDNLRMLRMRVGFSQEQVATQLQIMGFTMSREIISQMELGKHNIKVSVLLALRELYDASFDEFFRGLTLYK